MGCGQEAFLHDIIGSRLPSQADRLLHRFKIPTISLGLVSRSFNEIDPEILPARNSRSSSRPRWIRSNVISDHEKSSIVPRQFLVDIPRSPTSRTGSPSRNCRRLVATIDQKKKGISHDSSAVAHSPYSSIESPLRCAGSMRTTSPATERPSANNVATVGQTYSCNCGGRPQRN